MVNSPLIRPYFFGGVALGGPGPLGSHEGRRERVMFYPPKLPPGKGWY